MVYSFLNMLDAQHQQSDLSHLTLQKYLSNLLPLKYKRLYSNRLYIINFYCLCRASGSDPKDNSYRAHRAGSRFHVTSSPSVERRKRRAQDDDWLRIKGSSP